MEDVLEQIVEATRARLRTERRDTDAIEQAAATVASGRSAGKFAAALRRGNDEPMRVIAEIKSASPSAGVIVREPDVSAISVDYRDGGAAAISIVTEEKFFLGSHDRIAVASEVSGLPVVMKDFVLEPSQLHRGVAAGASAILLLASLLDSERIRELIAILDQLHCDALVEVHDEMELERAIVGGARIIGVNNRNLRTFEVDLGTSERLGRMIPAEVIKVSESGIRSAEDATRLRAAGYDALLVGESLLRRTDRSAAVRELRV
ncbi:MAG TPA: indole-3-glycerol phosphate synthase TrpC [Thermoanaerobaculia bacterium]|nr:indole-3-glycerol phosphate synthase TrpC [Thermoanaerobaculia bacterium]